MCEFFVCFYWMKSMSKRRWYLFRFIILIQCKKCYYVLKQVLFDWRKLFFLMSPFMRLFCCWFSFFLARGCFGSCRVVQCLVWFEVFFIHLLIFFSDLMKYNHGFFSPLFFLWDFLCLVSLRRGRFFCWMNWIVCGLSCRRICFFSDSNFFLMGKIKKIL